MMRRSAFIVSAALFIVVGALVFTPTRAQESATNNTALAAELLAALNKWRMGEGLYPLDVSGALQAMAEDQAAYVQSQLANEVALTDLHADARGRNPRVRAAQSYNWPHYGFAERIHIGENAAIGSVRSSIAYWSGSEIHRRAALSRIYREVGVAAMPTPGGNTLFIVVFGARPNVLPAQFDPTTRTLYLSEERSDYAPVYGSGLRISVFSNEGVPILGDRPWQSSLTLPEGVPDQVVVAYYNLSFAAVNAISLSRDLVIAPNTIALLSGRDAFARGVVPPAVIMPAAANLVAAQPSLAPIVPTTVASGGLPTAVPPTVPPVVAALPTAAPTAVPALPAVPLDRADLLLTYSSVGFTLRAVTTVNLTGLSIGSATTRIGPENWLRVAQFPADAFPRNHCLGANSGVDAACGYLRSLLSLGADRVFWNAPFDVTLNGTVIAVCTASPCAVDLP